MKSKKERLQRDCERYESIIREAKTSVHREDVYEKMCASIKRWIAENIDYAARAWFERIEQSVLRAQHNLNQKEFHFVVNPEAIVPLGDSHRVRLGHCDRELCEQRMKVVSENRDRQIIAADKEIAALSEVISRLQDGQTIDDLFP